MAISRGGFSGMNPVKNTGNMSWSIFDKNVRKLTTPGRSGGIYGAGGSNVRDLMSGYNERKANQTRLNNEAQQAERNSMRQHVASMTNSPRGAATIAAESREKLAAMQDALTREEMAKQYGFKESELAALTDWRNKTLAEQQADRERMYGFKESELAALTDWRNKTLAEQQADRANEKSRIELAYRQQGYTEEQAKIAAHQWEQEFKEKQRQFNDTFGIPE